MVAQQVIWHGSQQEGSELIDAINRNCTCEYGPMGARVSTCIAHKAFVEDQRWLDGLLFARQIRERLLEQEWRAWR